MLSPPGAGDAGGRVKTKSRSLCREWQPRQLPFFCRAVILLSEPSTVRNSQSPPFGLKPGARLNITARSSGVLSSGFDSFSP